MKFTGLVGPFLLVISHRLCAQSVKVFGDDSRRLYLLGSLYIRKEAL